jgi:hypothetical protein
MEKKWMQLNQNPQYCTLTDITEFLVDVEEGLLRGLGALRQAVHLILEALQQRRHRQPISGRLFSHVTGLSPIIKKKREFFCSISPPRKFYLLTPSIYSKYKDPYPFMPEVSKLAETGFGNIPCSGSVTF